MEIGFNIDRKARGLFFDRRQVIDAADRATRRVLSRFGAFVRTRSRSSIRRRRGSAPPGQPPRAHSGEIKQILFRYEPADQGVVIGPVRLNSAPTPGGKTVPELLEFGGRVRRDGRTLNYEPRPFMRPAFDKELDEKMPDLWRDSIRR
ncbi:MAG: hypothetical protein ACOCYE_02070 [Pseudomonadota bacterium]